MLKIIGTPVISLPKPYVSAMCADLVMSGMRYISHLKIVSNDSLRNKAGHLLQLKYAGQG